MYFNNSEEKVIDAFLGNLDKYIHEVMELVWEDDCKIEAKFDTCFDDNNDFDETDEKYEEFTSFAFTVVAVHGAPPVYITEDNAFLIDYHNFPKEILVNGEKIN